ncbi:MAG TPA: hypothetical protein VHN99_00540 [Deinococcales bacterium]|nr:hypothetical protein [Deinococcales bacterium]
MALADNTTIGPLQSNPVGNGLVSFSFPDVTAVVDDTFGTFTATTGGLNALIESPNPAETCFRPNTRPTGSLPFDADGMFFATINNPGMKQLTISAGYSQALPTGVTVKVRVGRYDWGAKQLTWETNLRPVGTTAAPQVVADNVNPGNIVYSQSPNGWGYTFGLQYYVCLAPGANDTAGLTISGTVTLTAY